MDQRKFISFLMLSVGIMMLFNIVFAPPPKPKKPPALVAGAQDGDQQPAAGKVAEDAADAEQAPADAPLAAAGELAELPEVAAPTVPQQFVTFGSLDPKSGYRMLVTATNTGAAVVRAEMSSSRYRDQHDRSGYMGELELKEVASGVQAQVVGAGTPAEAAGIQRGDFIVAMRRGTRDVAFKTVKEFRAMLARTTPGQQISLQLRRGDKDVTVGLTLAWRPFAVLRPEIDNYRMREVEPPADFVDRPSFLMTLPVLNGAPLKEADANRVAKLLEQDNWELAASDATSATFLCKLPSLNLDVIKRYTLAVVPPGQREDVNYKGYHLQMDIELKNTGNEAQSLAYRLDGPTGMPLEGWWYAHKISQDWGSAAGLRDVVVRFYGDAERQWDCSQITEGEVKPMAGQPLAYAGVDGQYFAAVLIPLKPLAENWFDTTETIVVGPKPGPREPKTYTNVTCRLSRQAIELAAGESRTDSFQVFIGPKRPALLAQYQAGGDPNYSLKDIVYYGWPLFAAVARVMLRMLHFFHGIVGNYGIAIIMLTVVVRGAMFPISYRQTKNMARLQTRMKVLKPEMDRINTLYKNDMAKRNQAMQELYRKHDFHPLSGLGGCLPLLLQLPVFVGLYKALMIDVELRQSPLFGHGVRWCSNLAAPDMFLNWSPIMPAFIDNGIGIFGLGPYLNILPLVTVALFLVTQKMAMPTPTDEQAAMQQKMMKYMTVLMGLFFYKVASGLCLYFIASSLWGIGERKLLPKSQTADATASGGGAGSEPGPNGRRPGDGGPKAGPNGSPRFKRPRKVKRKK